MNAILVLVPGDTWLGMGGGTSADLLRRLELPEVPGVEIGPSLFRPDLGGVLLELRHDALPHGRGVTLEEARHVLDEVLGRSITCPRCSRTSHHPRDVLERYCGFCHRYHEGPA